MLDNYQINHKVAEAFGKSMYHLGSAINAITLSNNNMKDADVASILEGAVHNPINSISIKHNFLGAKSISVLEDYLLKKEVDGKNLASVTSLKILEVTTFNNYV